MPDIRKLQSNAFRALLSCVVVGLLIENVILVRQNRRLKSPELTEQVRPGEHLVNLAAVGLDGRIQPIALPTTAAQRLVIFTFSPDCHFCQATQPIWTQLSKSLRQRGVAALWVSRDSVEVTREYCERLQIPLSNVMADPPSRSFVQLGLQAVPSTIVVGPGGLIEKVWSGALDRDSSQAVFSYFGISQASAHLTGAGPDFKQSASAKCCDVSAPKTSQ